MTKKELLESKVFQEMPDDTEIWGHSGCFYRNVEDIEKKKLWVDNEPKQVLAFYFKPNKYGI